MKTLLTTLSILLITTFAQASERLETLRDQRNNAIEAAVAPINDRYVIELEKLLKVAIASGELDEAVEVRKEIAIFKLEAGAPPIPQVIQKGTVGAFEDELIGTSWTFDDPANGPHRCEFERRGILKLFRQDEKGRWVEYPTTRKWEVSDHTTRSVKVHWFSSSQVITISEDVKTISGGMKNWVIEKDD